MKTGAIISTLILAISTFLLVLPDNADAARMGGGRSFGGRPSMSTPAQRPAMNQQTPQRQTQAAPGVQQRPGMGMMGGLFGGLLAGTLLGSLLSGNGLGGGGGIMDLLLIALLAYIGYMLYKRFKQRSAQQPSPAAANYSSSFQNTAETAKQGWNILRQDPDYTASTASPSVDVPAGFNVEEFIKGAKMAYTRMQQSWDKRDLADIAQFATPAVMNVLKEQLAVDKTPGHTDLIMVNAELLGVETSGNEQRAQVYFDVLMREDPSQPTPSSVREIWHFLRTSQNGNWKLDGIQQVE